MTTLTIKKFPKELYERLRDRAALHRRSMNSEAIACLEQLLISTPRDSDAVISEAESLNRDIGTPLPDLINEAKKQGRL
ncbi:MAG: Arc family DNA-binding protein [Rhodothermales bacterium]